MFEDNTGYLWSLVDIEQGKQGLPTPRFYNPSRPVPRGVWIKLSTDKRQALAKTLGIRLSAVQQYRYQYTESEHHAHDYSRLTRREQRL